jgi:hypothetical protein
MEPYQAAGEEIIRQGEAPGKFVKKALSTATSLATGGIAATKVLPFLSKYIPENLAMKGLSKLDPRFGKFIQGAQERGFSFDDIKDFMGEKIQSGEGEKEKENILSKYDPMLDKVLRYYIDQKGLTPSQAATHAEVREPKLKKIIEQVKKDFKNKNFAEIVENAYVNYKKKGQESVSDQIVEPQQQSQQAGQNGGLAPDIMAAMNDISQRLNKLKGV